MWEQPESLPSIAFAKLERLWGPLKMDERRVLTNAIECRRYQRHDMIYESGDAATHVGFILNGNVKMFKQGIISKYLILKIAQPGDFLGVCPFLCGTPFRGSAVAIDTVVVAQVPAKVMSQLCLSSAGVNNSLATYMANELVRMNLLAYDFTQKHLRGRMAGTLLNLSAKFPRTDDPGVINVRLTREDLANMSNMTTENASRTISAFKKENLLQTRGKVIKIIDGEGLRRVYEND